MDVRAWLEGHDLGQYAAVFASNDIDAEVRRLTALGASEVSRPHDGRWVVMQAPTGQRFCVVRPQRGRGDDGWNDWR